MASTGMALLLSLTSTPEKGRLPPLYAQETSSNVRWKFNAVQEFTQWRVGLLNLQL